MGRRCFSFLPLTSSFFSIYFSEEKFNNAKILITSRDVGVETRIERGRRRDETKAFYCVLNHKMRFSSSIKSKSSRKNNILLVTLDLYVREIHFRTDTVLRSNLGLKTDFHYNSLTVLQKSIALTKSSNYQLNCRQV